MSQCAQLAAVATSLFPSARFLPPPPSLPLPLPRRSPSTSLLLRHRLVQIGLRSSPLRAGVNNGKRWGEASGSRQGEPRRWPASAATSSPRRRREAAKPAPELPVREQSLRPPAVPIRVLLLGTSTPRSSSRCPLVPLHFLHAFVSIRFGPLIQISHTSGWVLSSVRVRARAAPSLLLQEDWIGLVSTCSIIYLRI